MCCAQPELTTVYESYLHGIYTRYYLGKTADSPREGAAAAAAAACTNNTSRTCCTGRYRPTAADTYQYAGMV